MFTRNGVICSCAGLPVSRGFDCNLCGGNGSIPWSRYEGPLVPPDDAVGLPEPDMTEQCKVGPTDRLDNIEAALEHITFQLSTLIDALADQEEPPEALYSLDGELQGMARDQSEGL